MKALMNSSVFSKGSIYSIHSCDGHGDMSGCMLRRELLRKELSKNALQSNQKGLR